MQTTWVFEHSAADEKQVIEAYWAKKHPRLERLLTRYPADQRKLHLTVRRRARGGNWMFRAVLHLTTGTLVVEAFGSTPQEAIDRTVDELVQELRSHKDHAQKDYQLRRRRRARQQFGAIDPFLTSDIGENRPESFFRLLMPHVRSIREYGRHELKVLELEGRIPINEVTPDDLVHDVVVTAWERFKLRPPTTLLEVWLMGLLQQRLDELCSQVKPITLAVSAALSAKFKRDGINPDGDRSLSWDESSSEKTVSLEELLPDHEGSDVWNDLTASEQQQQLTTALSTLSKQQRQTLMLHTVSGFELEEIATVLNVSSRQVAEWLDDARATLRARLEESQVI